MFKYLLLIISGAISALAFAPFYLSFAIVVSFIILHQILYPINKEIKKIHLIIYGYMFSLSFYNLHINWVFYSLYKIIHTPLVLAFFAHALFTFFLATYTALTIFIFIKIKTKFSIFNILLLFPSIWVLLEWLRGWFLTGFSWGSVGLTQSDNLIFKGLYPVLGEYGVSFVIISISGGFFYLINNMLYKQNRIFKIKNFFVLIYLFVILVLLWIIKDKEYTRKFGSPITVALVQGNYSPNIKWDSDVSLEYYKKVIKEIRADLVLIPETAITEFLERLKKTDIDELKNSSIKNHTDLIVGIPKIIDKELHYVNAAVLLSNSNQPYYAKNHLVPYGEYIPAKEFLEPLYKFVNLPLVGYSQGGSDQEPITTRNEILAFNICYENGFGSELITSAKKATVMVNLSEMAWYGNTVARDEHLQISKVRALENQRYFVQETNNGLTAIINTKGQIQSFLPPDRQMVLKDSIQGYLGETPYQKFGNYPIIILCFLIFMITLIL